MGASHVKNNKPCQDYSLSWHSDDNRVQVAIVCDGHGGDTYVRSDRGSRLAAEIALRNIRNAVSCMSPDLFMDKEGAVPARPEDEEDIFHSHHELQAGTAADLGADEEDIRVQRQRQAREFYAAVEPIREQDQFMQRLFAGIYLQWLDGIEEDARNNPFSEWELGKLNGARLVKAYGTTLMAFVRTPLYWFAFHIGDGKMLCCDANFNWREPVPWDCNCFLNMTTSLCEKEPLHSFRYAFNGKGEFPAAVIMGSDGLDDSWCTMDNLKNFYSQVLSIFNDLKEDETVREMRDYLPRLSEKGSRDDMSMAGIIDMDALAGGAAVYKKRRELNALSNENKRQHDNVLQLEEKFEAAKESLQSLRAMYESEKQKEEDWLVKLSMQKTRMETISMELQSCEAEAAEAEKNLTAARDAYNEWADEAKKQKVRLESDYNELLPANESYMIAEHENWERARVDYLKERDENRKNILSEKVANMMVHDEEALRKIHEAKFEPEALSSLELKDDNDLIDKDE